MAQGTLGLVILAVLAILDMVVIMALVLVVIIPFMIQIPISGITANAALHDAA